MSALACTTLRSELARLPRPRQSASDISSEEQPSPLKVSAAPKSARICRLRVCDIELFEWMEPPRCGPGRLDGRRGAANGRRVRVVLRLAPLVSTRGGLPLDLQSSSRANPPKLELRKTSAKPGGAWHTWHSRDPRRHPGPGAGRTDRECRLLSGPKRTLQWTPDRAPC